MKRTTTFLGSKVGRRIVLLFFSCALLPVTILAGVSVYQVSAHLRQQNRERLAQASKQQGMEIYERLAMLDSDLQIFSMQLGEGRSKRAGQILRGEFRGIAIFSSASGTRARWGGEVVAPDPFSAKEQQHLDAGNGLLRVKGCPGASSACIFLMRKMQAQGSGDEIVVSELNPQYLWAARTSAPDLHVCVLSAARAVLFCSDETAGRNIAALPVFRHSSGAFEWEAENVLQDAAFWKLLIGPTFLEEPWTVVVSQPHDEAIAPIVSFRRDFILVIILALWIVLFFSLVQVRRTLGPLARLQAGTQEIGAGRFEKRVEVHCGDEFEGLAASFNAMAARLERQFNALKTIHEIDQAIFASLDREAIVDGVLGRMSKLIPCDCFAVCVLDESRSGGWVRFHTGETGRVCTQNTAISDADWRQLQGNPLGFVVDGEEGLPEYLQPLHALGTRSFFILPIRFENSVQGALVCAQKRGVLGLQEMQEARQVADQLAVALSHVHLIRSLEQLRWGTLTALARAIDAKSKWTAGHSERTTVLALEIGRRMGLSAKDMGVLQMGGLLHDIGKIGTPPEVLDKPGKLTAEEMRIMKEHVSTGVRILEPVAGFRQALSIVAQHHEWYDGNGYPAGLAGQDISLYARIFAVADCYDALTSDRPYRKGLPVAQTIAMLQGKSGSQFDPEVIEAFTHVMAGREQPVAMAARQAQ